MAAFGFDILALRYMHTTVEMVHRDDVENVIKLI
jgi:putative aminopeptidase FrvX